MLKTLTEKFLKELTTKPEHAGKRYSDTGVEGLSVRAARNKEVTFTLRAPSKDEDRHTEAIGIYHPTLFTLENAQDKARVLKVEWKTKGVAVEAESPTLDEALNIYQQMREGGDKQAAGHVKGMMKSWDKNIAKFREMVDSILARQCHTLKRKDFVTCQIAYQTRIAQDKIDAAKARAKKRGEHFKAEPIVLDPRSLKPMWADAIQAIDYAVKQEWIRPSAAEDLVPGTYDPCTRFLLPGEWQRVAPLIDELPRDGGMFLRFLLATGARLSMALNMPWEQVKGERQVTFQDGSTHRIRFWHVPKGSMKKGRFFMIPLIGESLRIFEHFEKQAKDSEFKAERERKTVFTKEVISMWKGNSNRKQRWLEEQSGTERWTRHDLRRTLATYLKYVKTSQGLVAVVLAHADKGTKKARGERDGTEATKVYTKDDALGDCWGKNEVPNTYDATDMVDVVQAFLRVQELFRQMERGELTNLLARVQTTIIFGPNANEMIDEHGVDHKWIDVAEPQVIKDWMAQRKADVVAKKAAKKLASIEKKKASRAKAKAKVAATKKAKAQPEDTTATVQ